MPKPGVPLPLHFPLLLLALLLGACCNLPEEYAVTSHSMDVLTFAGPDHTRELQVSGRITHRELPADLFQPLYNSLGGRPGTAQAIVVTYSEQDPATNETVYLTLAIPSELRRGARYQVGGAFGGANVGRDVRQAWGTRSLRDADRAEVAFSIDAYTFPPPQHTATFVATKAEGTIDVVERGSGWFYAVVSLRMEDADGRVVHVTGQVMAQSESYKPSCT
jgi:hypothetical protein